MHQTADASLSCIGRMCVCMYVSFNVRARFEDALFKEAMLKHLLDSR